MSKFVRQFFVIACAVAAASASLRGQDDVAVLDGIVVEAPFDVRLELPQQSVVQIMIARLQLRGEAERTRDLEIANRNPVTRLLDLTKYSPISVGASEDRIDTFFLENRLRADLNPRRD
ncbi:MAG: hypothetical protein ABI992_06340, partial [Chthoniobacterales bacterium]